MSLQFNSNPSSHADRWSTPSAASLCNTSPKTNRTANVQEMFKEKRNTATTFCHPYFHSKEHPQRRQAHHSRTRRWAFDRFNGTWKCGANLWLAEGVGGVGETSSDRSESTDSMITGLDSRLPSIRSITSKKFNRFAIRNQAKLSKRPHYDR